LKIIAQIEMFESECDRETFPGQKLKLNYTYVMNLLYRLDMGTKAECHRKCNTYINLVSSMHDHSLFRK
jgi:hypothetical protein